MNRSLRIAMDALEFARDAGRRGDLPADLILTNIRREAALALHRIESNEAAYRARTRNAERRALIAQRQQWRPIYTPETAPSPLHLLFVEQVSKEAR